jgi:cell division protein FtsA
MDTRIGYPNEPLAGNSDIEATSPLYATAVGLVLNSIEQKNAKFQEQVSLKEPGRPQEQPVAEDEEEQPVTPQRPKPAKKSIFDKWAEKFKDFLDNAE